MAPSLDGWPSRKAPALGHRVALLDGGLPREPQGLALDDQVMAHAGRLVSQAVPDRDLGAHQIRLRRVLPRLREFVQAAVQRGQLVENPLEPLARPTQSLRLRLSDVALGASQPFGAGPVPVAGGSGEIVSPQLHAGPPLTRRYAATSRSASAVDPNDEAASRGADPELRPQVVVGQDLIDGPREGGGVFGHEETRDAIGHDLLDAARPDGHDREPAGHRLEDGQALRLARRREDEGVRRVVVRGQAGGRGAAPELDPAPQARSPPPRGAVRPPAFPAPRGAAGSAEP